MLKLVVFDWDGTLENSIEKIIACKQSVANSLRLEVPSDKLVKTVIGMPLSQALSICFPKASKLTLSKVNIKFQSCMKAKAKKVTLFPKTLDMLLQLKQRGFLLAIATSKPKAELDKILEADKFNNIFSLSCSGEVFGGKPNPAMLLHIMSSLSVPATQCIMVGDTSIDMEFASNANVKSIGVTFGIHTKKVLEIMRPIAIVNDWEDFLLELDKLCY